MRRRRRSAHFRDDDKWGCELRLKYGVPLLDQTTHDAERVVDGTLAFVEHELVATHREDADRAPPILHARDFDDFGPVVVGLFHEIRIPELVFRECLDVCNGLTSKTLREKINLVAFYVLDSKNVESLEEGERCVVDRVAQDGLLDEQNVAAALFDLLANIQKIGAPLFDDLVHLPVIVDDDGVVHLQHASSTLVSSRKGGQKTNIRLGRTELELNKSNLRFLDSCWAASCDNDVLIEHNTIDELGVFYCTANLLDDADIA